MSCFFFSPSRPLGFLPLVTAFGPTCFCNGIQNWPRHAWFGIWVSMSMAENSNHTGDIGMDNHKPKWIAVEESWTEIQWKGFISTSSEGVKVRVWSKKDIEIFYKARRINASYWSNSPRLSYRECLLFVFLRFTVSIHRLIRMLVNIAWRIMPW